MFTSNDFDILRKFVSYAELASQSGGLTSSAFENKSGSFLSILLCEQGDAYTVLRSINTLSKTLGSLTRLVEEGLSSSRRQLLPCVYNKGLHSLPFEIIAHMFELSEDKDNPYYSLTKLLLVNSYFRNLAVKIPALWTTVDMERDPTLALQRSGSRGLVVEVSNIDDSSRSGHFLRLLEPHIWRWQSFKLLAGEAADIDDSDSVEGVFLNKLQEYFKGKSFLGLDHLEISYEPESNLNWGLDVRGIAGEHFPHAIQNRTTTVRSFFNGWNMPALRSFTAIGFIPIIPLSCRTSLTSFRLGLGGEINIGGWDLEIISHILSSLSSLEELSLQFRIISTWRNGEGVRIELPSLKKLDLDLYFFELDPPRRLVDALSFPNLKELTFRLDNYLQSDITEMIEALFPASELRWPCLEVLSCTLDPADAAAGPRGAEDEYYPLDIMCSRLPPLHQLTISAKDVYQPGRLEMHQIFRDPTGDPWHPQAPPLRTLRLLKCNYFDTKFIIGLEKVIKAPEFERLEIVDCPNINIEPIRELMPIDKELHYTPLKFNSNYSWFFVYNVRD